MTGERLAPTLNVGVMDTGEERVIINTEPLESARLFLELSDTIWHRRPDYVDPGFLVFSVPIAVPVVKARDALNEVLATIDEELVVSGVGEMLICETTAHEKVEIEPELLAVPEEAEVETHNWDRDGVGRFVDIEGKKAAVTFTDGHLDYHRDLAVGFTFVWADQGRLRLIYSMQRSQDGQDSNTSLMMTVLTRHPETDHEVKRFTRFPLNKVQELALLRQIQTIGALGVGAS